MTTSLALLSLGARLRAERERRGFTLDELARLTGMSKAHLSRVESGDRQPAIATLLGLAEALGVRVGALLGEDGDEPLLAVHGPDTPGQLVNGLVVAPASGYRGSRELEALRIVIPEPRADAPFARHRGEEWLHVLHGTVHLDHDGVTHVLTRGCSVHFTADRPHRLRAPDGRCELLLVATSTTEGLGSTHS